MVNPGTTIADRALARQLRREYDLRTVLERMRRLGWSPRRCSLALELPEAYLVGVLTGRARPRKAARSEQAVRVALDSLSPAQLVALRSLVRESRGLWAVERWPTPEHVAAAVIRRRCAIACGAREWQATPLGCDVIALLDRRAALVSNP